MLISDIIVLYFNINRDPLKTAFAEELPSLNISKLNEVLGGSIVIRQF